MVTEPDPEVVAMARRLLYYCLYVILDIFSRDVVSWMVAEQKSADLARQFIQATYCKQNIAATPLTLHSDRGAPMRANHTQ